MTKPLVGHFAKAGAKPQKYLGEFPAEGDLPEVGSVIKVDVFEKGQKVDVSARSKGKGFQGVIKRYNFGGGPKTHGSQTWRRPGSIGMAADPSRVLKGMRMGGQTGFDNVTVQNLEIVEVRPEDNLLLVRGAVPGPNGGLVRVGPALKATE
jgi:large subunit ribosomal protein L3